MVGAHSLRKSARSSQRGSMTVEFLLIFPAFLILCLFTLELGFWYVDRHLLKLATFEASRSMLSYQYRPGMTQVTSCEDAMIFPVSTVEELTEKKENAMTSAHRELAIKMAYTAPPVTSFLSVVGLNVDTNAILGETFNATDIASSPIVKSMAQLLLRFPSAYALTQIESCEYNPLHGTISVKSRYLRRAKLPLVDRMIWLVFVISKMNDYLVSHGIGDLLRVDLDDFYLGSSLSSPALTQLYNEVIAFRTQLRDTVATLGKVPLRLEDAAVALGNFPFLRKLADQTTQYSGQWQQKASVLDTKLTAVAQQINAANQAINDQSSVVNAVIFAMPSELRLVPMYDTVTLSLAQDVNDKKVWDGSAFLVAPFINNGLQNQNVWVQWTRAMQENRANL